VGQQVVSAMSADWILEDVGTEGNRCCARQYLYFCISEACQYLYFCISEARQYLYFCIFQPCQYLYSCLSEARQYLYFCARNVGRLDVRGRRH